MSDVVNLFSAVTDFHKGFNIEIGAEFSERLVENRIERVTEEYEELTDATESLQDELTTLGFVTKETVAHFLSEIVDLLYVTAGMAITFGLPVEAALTAIHKANMNKLNAEGKPAISPNGKILKPQGWTPADITTLV